MQKIITAEEKQRRSVRNGRILALLMLIILLGSTAGYAFLSYSRAGRESQTDGQETVQGWPLKVGENTIYLSTSPASSSAVSVQTSTTITSYAGKNLYVDATSDAILAEIQNTLGKYAYLQEGCYGSCERDVPELNCTSPLIVWRGGSENSVHEEEQCVFIDGDMRSVDAFLYRIFGK